MSAEGTERTSILDDTSCDIQVSVPLLSAHAALLYPVALLSVLHLPFVADSETSKAKFVKYFGV